MQQELTINGQRAIQQGNPLYAESITLYDQKRKTTVISFSVEREHPTIQDAELFILEHETEVPHRGLVTLMAFIGSGRTVERFLKNAVVEQMNGNQRGVRTTHTYTIRGGKILDRKPE